MKHYIFETKEEYINMKQRWADYFNKEARNVERNEYGNKIKKLTATHFILYAILRGKDPHKALNSCCWDTIEDIGYDIAHARTSKWYNGKWKDFFGLTDEQHEKMLEIAHKIFKEQKDFATVEKELKEAADA